MAEIQQTLPLESKNTKSLTFGPHARTFFDAAEATVRTCGRHCGMSAAAPLRFAASMPRILGKRVS